MTMYDTKQVINMTDIKELRDECLRLTTQNNMMADARRMDANEYRRLIDVLWERHKELHAALKRLYEEQAEYIRLNNLGDVNHNESMRIAKGVLDKYEL